MSIRTYGPTKQRLTPANAGEVSVVDHDGTAVTLTTPVSVGASGITFAVDDATAPHDIFVKVTNAATGNKSEDRWRIGGDTSQGQLRANIKAAVATLETAIGAWGAPSGTYTIAKDTAILAALKAIAADLRLDSGQTEQPR